MKVVALVSGGKDSAYNLLHCTLQGHQVVALANLYPPASHGSDEMDSFMYQTVGYSALEHYADCLAIPMYRQPIKGKSLITSLEYRPAIVGDEAQADPAEGDTDETEDLFRLLLAVLKAHPDVDAVSVGAILSTYQRVRVENVCQRLGLTCLAFLWERSQGELLDEIIASGTDARLIKVAAHGLGKQHLGKSLAELKPQLARLNADFGLHLCGEGGEYETLVFDSPLFKRTLVANTAKVVEHSASDNVYFLKLSDFETREKPGYNPLDTNAWKDKVAVPPLLDSTYEEVLNQIRTDDDYYKPRGEVASNTLEPTPSHPETEEQLFYEPDKTMHIKPRVVVNKALGTVWISNITAPPMASDYPVEHVTELVFDKLRKLLAQEGLGFEHIMFAHALLKDMADFAQFNRVYSTFFSAAQSNPPARVCVENGSLVHNSRVQLTVVATTDLASRSGLHVQSRSYWAPANIGPYSQAVSAQGDGVIYFAGQVPIVPATLELLDAPAVEAHAVLSLQHLNRVAGAYKPITPHSTAPCYAALVAYVTSPAAGDAVAKTWSGYLAVTSWAGLDEEAIKDVSYYHGHRIDVPLFIVQLSGLPKGAQVEWTGYGIDGQVLKDAKAEFDLEDHDEEEEKDEEMVEEDKDEEMEEAEEPAAPASAPVNPYFFKPLYSSRTFCDRLTYNVCRFGTQAFATFTSDTELLEAELRALYAEIFATEGTADEADATGNVIKPGASAAAVDGARVTLVSGTLFYTDKAPVNGLLLNEVKVDCITMLDRKKTNKVFGYIVRLALS